MNKYETIIPIKPQKPKYSHASLYYNGFKQWWHIKKKPKNPINIAILYPFFIIHNGSSVYLVKPGYVRTKYIPIVDDIISKQCTTSGNNINVTL